MDSVSHLYPIGLHFQIIFLNLFFFVEWENAYKGVDLKENTQPKSYEFQFYLGTSLRMIAWERAF